jgi:hypothetical protein
MIANPLLDQAQNLLAQLRGCEKFDFSQLQVIEMPSHKILLRGFFHNLSVPLIKPVYWPGWRTILRIPFRASKRNPASAAGNRVLSAPAFRSGSWSPPGGRV